MADMTVANTIIRQMGGMGKLRAMVSASNFVGDDNSVQFKFKGSRKFNICKVTLNALDLYTFELYHFNSRTYELKKKYELENVYWDMLKPVFEKETGLYLSL